MTAAPPGMIYNNGFTGTNLVMDLQVSADDQLVAATHGRGVAISPLYSGTLPVYFALFKGVHQQGTNKLEWHTQNETNLLRFDLERSTDARLFTSIASFSPANNDQSDTYVYDDVINGLQNIYYYRVKAINLDGTIKYSPVLALQAIVKNNFSVVNTLFSDNIVMKASLGSDQIVHTKIYDAGGSLIRRQPFSGSRGSNSFILNGTGSFTPGIYILEVFIDRQRYTQKLLKQ